MKTNHTETLSKTNCSEPTSDVQSQPKTRIQRLVQELNEQNVTGIGARAGYFSTVPKLKFGLINFSLEHADKPNPRVIEEHLHLDLWFNPERTVDSGALDEQISHGQRLIKQTVVITDIDYINKDNLRLYWA